MPYREDTLMSLWPTIVLSPRLSSLTALRHGQEAVDDNDGLRSPRLNLAAVLVLLRQQTRAEGISLDC